MSARLDLRKEWLFAALLVTYCAIYALWYPATISIFDESSIVVLAYSIEHGTIYTEVAGPTWGLQIGSHRIEKYSPFHAAMLAPAMALNWRLMFIVSAAFFVAGALILRSMLRRNGLGSGWCALYFLLAGGLYYSQTVMAAVPAAVMGLLGISLCLRQPARPALAGLAFGVSVLFHPWMAPIAIVFCAVWLIENRFAGFGGLLLGAIPSIVLLATYNYLTTGSPIQNVYTLQGHQHLFGGEHWLEFLIVYAASLAMFPLAGWAVFSRRWSGTWALPAVGFVVIAMASLYYYRDGNNFGSSRVATVLAEISGLVPGQRFLLPLSMIACLPAARFLNSRLAGWISGIARLKLAVLGGFAVGFALLSIFHQAYLRAHANLQEALHQYVPPDAPVAVSSDLSKEFVPLGVVYRKLSIVDETDTPAHDAYVAILLSPGQSPPPNWSATRSVREVKIRSWIWNRDLLIAGPVGAKD